MRRRDLVTVLGAIPAAWSLSKIENLPRFAGELVALQPRVILAIGTAAALAAKSATQDIPIVFARIGDPVRSGLVAGLARPGANLTGLSIQFSDLAAKRLELLVAAVPDAKRVGALWVSSYPTSATDLSESETAARLLDVSLVPVDVRGPDDFEPALRTMVEQGAGAVTLVPDGAWLIEHGRRLADLLINARLPSMFPRQEYAEAGCLMSYGPNLAPMFHRAAAYVDKILKGAKPADLPVEQPTKFELLINLKTANALG